MSLEHDRTLTADGTASAVASGGAFAAGSHVAGRYAIIRFIAAGGMGEVYEAEDKVLGARVALKAVRVADAVDRLKREIALARKVTHPNVCRVHDVGEHGGRAFLTMELLGGETLAARLARGALDDAELERIASQLIAALGALHAAGIVHRDFKSSNIMLDGERVVVTDFGLARSEDGGDARLTADASLLGTPAYMAPEQVEGRAATPASDIYALGVVLYEMATGKLPFAEDTPLATATARLTRDPPVPQTSSRWQAAILRCLERAPADRPRRVEDVLGARRRRRRGGLLLAAAGIVAVAAGTVAVIGGRGPEPTTPTAPVDADRYARRTIPVRIETMGSTRLTPSGDAVVYADHDARWWQVDLATAAVTPAIVRHAADFRPLADGRIVVANRDGEPWITIEDPRDGTRHRLIETEWTYVSVDPSEQRAIIKQADWLVLVELATGETRRLVEAWFSRSAPRWSPDGAWILWAHDDYGAETTDRLFVTRVSDGHTRKLVVQVAGERNMSMQGPADFLPDGRVVYCAEDESGIEVRARSIDDPTGAGEVTLTPLDAAVSTCAISAVGDRVSVLLARNRTTLAVVDLGREGPEVRMVAGDAPGVMVSEVSHDGEVAYVRHVSGWLAAVSLSTGVATRLPACADLHSMRDTHHGGYGFLRRGSEMLLWDLRVEAGAHVLRLRAPTTCADVAEWRFDSPMRGAPVCTATRCLIGTWPSGDEEELAVIELRSDGAARELARTKTPGHMDPVIAISPDERSIVMTAGLRLHRLEDDRLVEIPFEGSTMSVAWGRDPDRFLLATQPTTGDIPFGLWWVARDGRRELAWSSSTTWVSDLRSARQDDRVVLTARPHTHELILLEATP